MDSGAYVEAALRLVNHPLASLEDAQALLEGRGWLRERMGVGDLVALQGLQCALADVVDRSAAGDEAGVVEEVNALLGRHPVRPVISGHDASSWHLHVTHVDEPVPDILAAETIFGLALYVTEHGAGRFGRCHAPGCGRAFLDTSTNRTRRYCSQRCATRVNVAAHRARVKE